MVGAGETGPQPDAGTLAASDVVAAGLAVGHVLACLVCGLPLAPVLARLGAALCHDCRELGESAWERERYA